MIADETPHEGPDPSPAAPGRGGLRLTPAERLRWLEETMEALRRWEGRARERPGAGEGAEAEEEEGR